MFLMKKVKIIFSIFIITITFTLLLNPKNVLAKSSNVNKLKNKIDKTDAEQINSLIGDNSSIGNIYENTVIPMLISQRLDFGYPNLSDEEINSVTLSSPMPIFFSHEKYKKGEDFKSKLEHSGWMFIVYIKNKPAAAFSVKYENNRYAVINTFGEDFAKAFADTLSSLNGDIPIVLPVNFRYLLADTNDNIVLVNAETSIDNTTYDIKTFDELNNAANKAINYYNTHPEDDAVGGTRVLDYLYGDIKTNVTSHTTYAIVSIIGIAFLITALILFKNKKLKSTK